MITGGPPDEIGQLTFCSGKRGGTTIVNSRERNYHRALKELQGLVAARRSAAAEAEPTLQPEDPKTTSESWASLRTNPQTALETPSNPVAAAAGHAPTSQETARKLLAPPSQI
jgi:hypothetical protein